MLHENKIDVVEQIATHFESMQSVETAMKQKRRKEIQSIHNKCQKHELPDKGKKLWRRREATETDEEGDAHGERCTVLYMGVWRC